MVADIENPMLSSIRLQVAIATLHDGLRDGLKNYHLYGGHYLLAYERWQVRILTLRLTCL